MAHSGNPPAVRARGGFALLAVLWILFGVSMLALAMALAGRRVIVTAQYRLDLARARWGAEDCIERARAAIADVLAGRATWLPDTSRSLPLDVAVARAPILLAANCRVTVQPTGVGLDVNSADTTALRALFRAVGIGDTAAATLARAVFAWRDTTAHARATDSWYAAHRRPLPRHASFVDIRELHLVHGYDDAFGMAPALDTLLTVEADGILLDRAPAPLLATLPGMTPDAIAQVLAARTAGIRIADATTLAANLSGPARDSLDPHLTALAKVTTATPAAWLLRAVGTAGRTPVATTTIELRLIRTSTRAAILRRKVWP